MDENTEMLLYIYQNAKMGVNSCTELIRILNSKDNKKNIGKKVGKKRKRDKRNLEYEREYENVKSNVNVNESD